MKCKNLYTDVIIFASSVCVYVGMFKDIKEYTFIEGGEGKTSHTDSSNEQIFPLKGMLWEAAAPLGIGMRKLPPSESRIFPQLCGSDVQAPSPPCSQFLK